MERHEFTTSIRNSWEILDRVTLAESFATPESLRVDVGFRDLALSGNATHDELYRYCLSRSIFNVLLFDHSFFQYTWEAADNMRFAYYPNPYASRAETVQRFRRYRSMVRERMLEEEDFLRIVDGMDLEGGIPIFRYEYAPSQYVALSHPASHLHIGTHSQNRWAISRVLSPLAFTMLMIKHYFPAEWALGVEGLASGEINAYEAKLISERQNCRIVSDDYLDEYEKRTFSFG